jgi:hypothetical protein
MLTAVMRCALAAHAPARRRPQGLGARDSALCVLIAVLALLAVGADAQQQPGFCAVYGTCDPTNATDFKGRRPVALARQAQRGAAS